MSHPDHLLVLQSRWRPIDHDTTPSLLYYGVRNPPRQRRSLLPISAPLAALLDSAEHPLNPAAMVLYTGGKDSSYMLWLLARKLGLRVLAAFWNMPYCSDAAYDNIRRARQRMDQPPAMLGRLVADLQISQEEIRCAGDELSFSLAEWATGS